MSTIKLSVSTGGSCSFTQYLMVISPLINLTKKERDLLNFLYEANPEEITTDSRDEAFAMSKYSNKPVMNNVIKSIRDKGAIGKDNKFHSIINSYDPNLKEIVFSF